MNEAESPSEAVEGQATPRKVWRKPVLEIIDVDRSTRTIDAGAGGDGSPSYS